MQPRKLCKMHRVLQQHNGDVAKHPGHRGRGGGLQPRVRSPAREGERGLLSRAACKALIYLDWNNLSVAVILTTSVLRSQSGAALVEAFMSSHKRSKMKTQGPLKYTPRVCAVQLEAFMTPVRAFMTL